VMSTLLLTTVGGHLTQLVDIAARLPDDGNNNERVWVTHDHAQSRSLLAGERVVCVPYIGMRDVPGTLRSVSVARRLRAQHRPTTAISSIAVAHRVERISHPPEFELARWP